MRMMLLILIQVALFSVLALWYHKNPGHIDIHWLGYHIHMNVLVFFGVLLIAFSTLYIVGRTVMGVIHIPQSIKARWSQRHAHKQTHDLETALTALYIEDAVTLKKMGKRFRTHSQHTPLYHVFLGQSAFLHHDYDTAEVHFTHLTKTKTLTYLGYYGLARIAVDRDKPSQAISYLDQALTAEPSALPARYMLLTLTLMEGLYDRSLRDVNWLLKRDPDNHALTLQKVDCLRGLADHNIDHHNFDKALIHLKEAFTLHPHDVDIQRHYVETLCHAGRTKEALKIIETIWTHSPYEGFVDIYLTHKKAISALEQFKILQGLIKRNPEHPASLRQQVIYATKARLWGPAHDAIETLKTQGHHPDDIAPLVDMVERAQALSKA